MRKTSGSDDGRTFKGATNVDIRDSVPGWDSGAGVTDDCPAPGPGASPAGRSSRVAVDVSGQPYIDLEREAEAMLIRE